MTGWYPMDGHTPGDGDASREDLDDERAGVTFPGHDAGVTDEPCTPTNPCRSCRERMAAKDARIEPGRPVEDRDEPTGVSWASGAALVELIDSTGKRLDGLIDVVLHQEERLTGKFDTLIAAVHDLTVQLVGDESPGGEPLVTKAFADAQYDKGVNDGMASGKSIGAREAFERGRQQGDADRAARGQTEFERGRTIGQSEREAELLDAGWTPPGGVHELEVSTGPSEYEVWRDALTLAVARTPVDDESPRSDRQSVRYDAHGWADELRTLGNSVPDDEADPDDDEPRG